MSQTVSQDWNPGTYATFRGFRLRPALDLLAQVPDLPKGDVIDLGCGNGMPAAELRLRFSARGERRLIGVDSSANMLAEADALGVFDRLDQADIALWQPHEPPALIFSNAALHWLPEHDKLMPALAECLAPEGALAVQMPVQFLEPSHSLLRDIAAGMYPDRFDYRNWTSPVADAAVYHDMLAPLGELSIWESRYFQHLDAVETGHPVRHFTQSTATRPMAEKMDDAEKASFVAAYDEALHQAYPLAADGSALMPFKRLFFVLKRND